MLEHLEQLAEHEQHRVVKVRKRRVGNGLETQCEEESIQNHICVVEVLLQRWERRVWGCWWASKASSTTVSP